MDTTSVIQEQLDRVRGGDSAAREELFAHVQERLRSLVRRMLRDFPRVRRWEDTDDVLQKILIRLNRALAQVRVDSPIDFFRLAGRHLRHELIDLARHYSAPSSPSCHYATPLSTDDPMPLAVSPDSPDAGQLELWAKFHAEVNQLPEPERLVFDLLFYHGLGQQEAAELLQISRSTLVRRWVSARARLVRTLELPR